MSTANPFAETGLPDIANFPDVADEWRNNTQADLSALRSAFTEFSEKKFLQALNDVTDYSSSSPLVSNAEKEFEAGWKKRLRSFFRLYAAPENGEKSTQNDSELNTNGYLARNIDTVTLQNMVRDDVNKLETAQPVLEAGHFDRSLDLNETIAAEVNRMMEDAGMLEIASKFKGRPLKVDRAVLHLSMPDDTHWRQFLGDCDTTPPLTNLHFDPKEDIKAIVYLNDIDAETGAFSIIPDSHKFQLDPLQNIFSRAIATGNFCASPTARQSIFRLPGWLRVTANFGRLITPETPAFSTFMSTLRPITSNIANCILFQSGRLMHLGGKVRHGRREALQLIIR